MNKLFIKKSYCWASMPNRQTLSRPPDTLPQGRELKTSNYRMLFPPLLFILHGEGVRRTGEGVINFLISKK